MSNLSMTSRRDVTNYSLIRRGPSVLFLVWTVSMTSRRDVIDWPINIYRSVLIGNINSGAP